MVPVLRRLRAAVAEAYEAGFLGTDILGSGYDLDLIVHAGAGAYICGEETALLDSLEGRRGQPGCGRRSPRSPDCMPAHGGQQRRIDRQRAADPGQRRGLVQVDGYREIAGFHPVLAVRTRDEAGQYEAALGITLRELLEYAGGVRAGRELKFWTPGGSSTPLLTAEHLDVPLDYEGVAAAGSMLGTKALQIFDDTTCVVRAVRRWTQFYAHESCGKCTPCREGTYWLAQIYERLETVVARRGLGQAARHLRCHPGQVVLRSGRRRGVADQSSLKYFRAEYEAHLAGGCPFDPYASMLASPQRWGVTDLVTVTIDDVTLSVPKGTLVIRAAEMLGVQIPRFCDHPLLDPVGACRQCLIEVEGQRKPMASCTTTVTEGMVVRTQFTSEAADKAQQGVMELLLINHPLDCPVCDKGGECPLQNQAMSSGAPRPASPTSNAPSPSRSACRPRYCWIGSAACCAPDAPGSLNRSPATPSSNCSSVAPCSRWASRPARLSTPTSAATRCRSARSAR